MSRPDQRHAALGDRARRFGLGLGADFIDDDDLRHVVFNRFDHHRMLQCRVGDLHAACRADARMRDVAVARNLVRGIYDHHALAIFGKHPRAFTQHRRLAHARRPQQTDRFTAAQDVEQNVDRAVHRSADAAGETDDFARPIADRADAVQRLFDSRPIVGDER